MASLAPMTLDERAAPRTIFGRPSARPAVIEILRKFLRVVCFMFVSSLDLRWRISWGRQARVDKAPGFGDCRRVHDKMLKPGRVAVEQRHRRWRPRRRTHARRRGETRKKGLNRGRQRPN